MYTVLGIYLDKSCYYFKLFSLPIWCTELANSPLHRYIGDHSDVMLFLQRDKHQIDESNEANQAYCMDCSYAKETVKLIGGRIK